MTKHLFDFKPTFGSLSTDEPLFVSSKDFEANKEGMQSEIAPEQKRIAQAIINLGKDILRSGPRAIGSMTLQALKPFGGSDVMQPRTYPEKLFFGETPLESISLRQKLAPQRAKEFGLSEDFAKKAGPLMVPILTGLDLLPIGPSKGKKVTTSILEAIKDKKVLSASELQGIINRLMKTKGVKKEEIDLVMKHAQKQSEVLAKIPDPFVFNPSKTVGKEAYMFEFPAEMSRGNEEATQFVYHQTPLSNLDGIKKEGLLPSKNPNFSNSEKRIYAALSPEETNLVLRQGSSKKNVMLRLRVDDSYAMNIGNRYPMLDEDSISSISYGGKIPVNRIEVFTKDGWKSIANLEKTGSSLFGDTGKLNIPQLISDVESELLPLTPSHVKAPKYAQYGSDYLEGGKYGEIVYESPIKTSAQNVHFGNEGFGKGAFQDFPGYVGHVRYEDTLDPRLRRVIEWQSDLMQKGNLERELGTEGLKLTHIDDINTSIKYRGIQQTADNMSPDGIAAIQRAFNEAKKDPLSYSDNTIKKWGEVIDRLKKLGPRTEQVNRLKAYAEDFAIHKRMFREEIKRAAIDGKRYLETPKGDTAMKIEGLGETRSWYLFDKTKEGGFGKNLLDVDMKAGMEVRQFNDNWIITDILGEGKFRAVPKSHYEEYKKYISKSSDVADRKHYQNMIDARAETHDISGKVDEKHFVYRLNEKEIPREARRQGLVVTDAGDFWRIEVPAERAKMPVEAFGVGAIPFLPSEREKD